MHCVLNVQEIMVVIQTAGIYRGRWLTNVSMGMVVMEGEIRGLSCLQERIHTEHGLKPVGWGREVDVPDYLTTNCIGHVVM